MGLIAPLIILDDMVVSIEIKRMIKVPKEAETFAVVKKQKQM